MERVLVVPAALVLHGVRSALKPGTFALISLLSHCVRCELISGANATQTRRVFVWIFAHRIQSENSAAFFQEAAQIKIQQAAAFFYTVEDTKRA